MDSDAANVFIALAARSLNPGIFIVARASEVASAERLYRAGADRVISPYVTSGRHMATQALRPRVLDYFEVGREASGLRLEEVEIDEGSDLVGRTLEDIAGNAMTLVVKRSDGERRDEPATNIQSRCRRRAGADGQSRRPPPHGGLTSHVECALRFTMCMPEHTRPGLRVGAEETISEVT